MVGVEPTFARHAHAPPLWKLIQTSDLFSDDDCSVHPIRIFAIVPESYLLMPRPSYNSHEESEDQMITMKSKYNSTCRRCGGKISVGDTIAKRDGSWAHEVCPQVIKPAPKSSGNGFVPSAYQRAIFDAGLNRGGNIVVNATAGSGKTRTIQEFIRQLQGVSWVYLVFNKKNQVEAQEKFGDIIGGSVSTFHSFCLNGPIRSAYGKVRIDDRKVRNILRDISDYDEEGELWPIVNKVVGLVKNTLCGTTNADLLDMCNHYAVDLNDSADGVFDLVRFVLDIDAEDTTTVDFDDMIWLTAINNLPVSQFDYVLVDETQDLNAAQIHLVLRLRKPDGMTIAIGDTNQAIYGFRGADADAMDKVIESLDARVLPLSLCYRNPKSVVRLVNDTFPNIAHECLPNAPEGEVGSVHVDHLMSHVQEGDMVICRTNAPLVKPAFELIRNGIKAVIVGRNIGEEIVNLIERVAKKSGTSDLGDVLAELARYRTIEVSRLMKQDREAAAQALDDKVDTIAALADGCEFLDELKRKAETIFSDTATGVVFSSAHRAKGLEADNVFILKYDQMPHPMAVKSGKAWQLRQEANIKFVALTRARNKLVFVEE